MKDKISILLILIVVVSITGFVVNLISSMTKPEEVRSIKLVKEEKPKEEKTKFKEITKETELPIQGVMPQKPEKQIKKEKFKKIIPQETIKEKKPKKRGLLLEEKEKEIMQEKKEDKDEVRKLTEELEDYKLERDILADRLAQLEEETFLLQKKLANLQRSSVSIEAEKNKFLSEIERLKKLQEIHECEKTILRDKLEDTSRKLKDTSLALDSLIQEHRQLAISYLYQARNMIDKLDKMPTHIIDAKLVKILKENLKEAEKAFENNNYLKSITLSVSVKEEAYSLIEKIKNKISSYNKSLMDKFLTLFIF